MSDSKRSRMKARLTINKKPRKLKSNTRTLPAVTECDHCLRDLGRECVRTQGSAVCAAGEGIVTKKHKKYKWLFFCSDKCADEWHLNHSRELYPERYGG